MCEQNAEIQKECIPHFWPKEDVVGVALYGNGHINDTYLVTLKKRRYILQKMNKKVFPNPVKLMENISGVTKYLRKKIEESGGDPNRETLNVIHTVEGMPYYLDTKGEYWRAFQFVEDAISYEQPDTADMFYQSAVAFGIFQRRLSDYPADKLHETIPDFHDTRKRFLSLLQAVKRDSKDRVKTALTEIDFYLSREAKASVLLDKLALGELPIRVTHNDTKLNNILMDKKTGKGLCVIDLDTVMPGLSAYDFGDSIRSGANTGREDETDLSKVQLDLALFEAYTKGFVKGCEGSLTEEEIRMLPMGAYLMTYECGMRFLADYLEGDVYFKIHRDSQNLDRCRTQMKLVADMEEKWDALEACVLRL